MSTTVTIQVLEADRARDEVCFDDGPTACTVGRARDCGLRLPSDDEHCMISRRHCRIDMDPPAVWLLDLGSLNGTFLNGVCVGCGRGREPGDPSRGRRFRLYSGDEIRLGNTVLRVKIRHGSPPAETEGEGAGAGSWQGLCGACL
jgi:pSer/pThr/pTyr-binding forkhead associated (FHA) protein